MNTFLDRASQLDVDYVDKNDGRDPPIFEQDGMVLIDPEGRRWPIVPAIAQVVQFSDGPDEDVGGNILITPVRYDGRDFNVRIAYSARH